MSYYCSDTHCNGRISINLKEDSDYINNNLSNCKNIKIIKNHSIPYRLHSYAREKEIKFDIENLGKISIIKKCHDYLYLKNFIKEVAMRNSYLCYKSNNLEEYIKNNFKGIKIDYSTIDKNLMKSYINDYKQKNNIKDESDIDIKKIFNLTTICNSISSLIKNYNIRNNGIHQQILNIKYKEKNICYNTQIEFIRKNKKFKKTIYFFITEEMKNTLLNSTKFNQWFMDCTYYAIPRNNNQYQLLLIIGFNKQENISYLGSIVLIKNENIETFTSIFNYLKTNYNFAPISINVDCSIAEIISIKKNFPNTKIILCYYHILKRIIKHIPEIKCKDKLKKKKAMNLLANIKILLYLNKNKVKDFFNMIQKYYEKEFPSFIKYFYYNFFKKYPLNDLCWVYDLNFIFENNNLDNFFLTNNICESTNRLLNMNYKGVCKSIKNFEDAIISLIDIYENKNKYVEGKFNITRAIALYIRTENVNKLIDNDTMETIAKNYYKYLKDNNIEYNENANKDNCDYIINEYYEKIDNINKENNYSSNYESSSSVDSEEEIIYDYVPFDSNSDNDGDNGQNKKKNSKKNSKFNNIKKKNNEPKNYKKGKNNKKNSDQDCFANEDGKTYKEDEGGFSYNNIKNLLLPDSSNFYDKYILSENKIEFDILKSYKNKRFLIIYNSFSDKLKNIIIDEKIALKLKWRKNKMNAIIAKFRFGIKKLILDSN